MANHIVTDRSFGAPTQSELQLQAAYLPIGISESCPTPIVQQPAPNISAPNESFFKLGPRSKFKIQANSLDYLFVFEKFGFVPQLLYETRSL